MNGHDLTQIGYREGPLCGHALRVAKHLTRAGMSETEVLQLLADVLANPVKLTAFLQAVTSSLTVDDQLDLAGMTGLAYSLRSIDASDITLTTRL